MPGAQRTLVELALDGRRQGQQSQCVGDMAAAFADGLSDIALAMPELLYQTAVGLRLLERCQILPLEVLDERDLQDLGIAKRPDDDRHLVQSGTLRRSPAPFARSPTPPLMPPLPAARGRHRNSAAASRSRDPCTRLNRRSAGHTSTPACRVTAPPTPEHCAGSRS